jgi:Flp pilus assembly protein TadD
MARGKKAFEAGDYALAARQFLLAATLDQGDPASRLAAAHALVAVGTFEPAVRLLRRAFELQPRLVYLPLQIRGAYGNPDHFALHLTALREAARNDENNPGIWFLLGYFGYYSDHMAEAADALERAAKLRPTDGLIQQLFELASLSAPRTSRGSDERKSQPRDDRR